MDIFRTPDERFEGLSGYSFAPRYLHLDGELSGLRMHYVDEGAGQTLVLLHGEPTWAYLYRKMIPPLAGSYRVIAPDFIGFGRSDKVTDDAWYSYDRHCHSLLAFLRCMELEGVTLVVQDWGGPIGLRVAMENQDLVDRLVILNTGLYRPGATPTDAWKMFRDFVVATPDLPVGMLIQGATATDLPDEVIAGYEAPFPTVESKAGARAFPLLVPGADDHRGAAEMSRTAEALTRWEKPTLVAYSDSDPVFPQKAGRALAERIPGATFTPIEGASHFLQEDKGEEVASAILSFLGSDGE